MKVILLKSVSKVGKSGDIVEVNQGYAVNALFPKKLAIPATEGAVKERNQKLANAEAGKAILHRLLDAAIAELQGQALTYKVKASDQGNLFSKITEKDIAAFLETQRIIVDAKCIVLPEGSIKHVGTYDITIVDGSYRSTMTLNVVKE